MQAARPLLRILGLGFGIALVFGNMIGVGILRLPGMIAASLGDRTLIMLFWALGGLYALMGAVAVAELAAMIPETGGFRIYARRAFGERFGFAIGWCDWLCNVGVLASGAVTAIAFLGALSPAAAAHPRMAAISILAAFTAAHWMGLRIGSSMTRLVSTAIGLMFMVLVGMCFLAGPVAQATAVLPAGTAASLPLMSIAMLVAIVPALRAVLTAYDGWYSPIYMAEEQSNPTRTVPRAIIGGTLLVSALYLIINFALLRVLPLPVLAASELPAADVARLVFPRAGAELVTWISLFTILSLLNTEVLIAPRILFSIGRDGLFTDKAAVVSDGGTPRIALTLTSVVAASLILSGTFVQIIALNAVLFLLYYVSAFAAVFVLRHREPMLPRPYKAFGYPFSTAVVLVGSVAFLSVAIAEDPRSGVIAAALLSACVPAYSWMAGRRLRRVALAAA
jgi:APA family basic amino acid/polyamine antiporter